VRTAEPHRRCRASGGLIAIAFIVVYFIVYAAGLTYLFRLMASPPHHGEEGPSGDAPARAAASHQHRGAPDDRHHRPSRDLGLIIAFAVFVYIVMDGFDLGLGMLFPMFPKKPIANVIMNSVARSGTATRPGWCSARRIDGRVSAGLRSADAGDLTRRSSPCCSDWCFARRL